MVASSDGAPIEHLELEASKKGVRSDGPCGTTAARLLPRIAFDIDRARASAHPQPMFLGHHANNPVDEGQTCPRCGGPMSKYPASSRRDRENDGGTTICAPCGRDEASVDLGAAPGRPILAWWPWQAG